MIINDIGISAHAGRLDGSLEQLAHDLDYFQKLGYTLGEALENTRRLLAQVEESTR